jgi:hypothetical protein
MIGGLLAGKGVDFSSEMGRREELLEGISELFWHGRFLRDTPSQGAKERA